ncbi:Antimicrobial peptide 1 [Nymphaea thermarum]|nr:Antimicrobial peptide 1 [Nymphaea thermarum]
MGRALPHVMATFFVVLLVVAFATTANASYLTVYKEPGCEQPADKYYDCGCHNIEYYGGYEYYYEGEPAVFYKYEDCKGDRYPYYQNQKYCYNFDEWKSIYIKC